MSEIAKDYAKLATKLRVCKPLAVRVDSFGLDITLNESDVANLEEFGEMWQSLLNSQQAQVLALAGLNHSELTALVELIKHLEAWRIGEEYGS